MSQQQFIVSGLRPTGMKIENFQTAKIFSDQARL